MFTNLSDTVMFDTASTIPSSLQLYFPNGLLIESSYYDIDYIKSEIYLSEKLREKTDSINVVYKVFPYKFNKTYFHKDTTIIKPYSNIYNPSIVYESDRVQSPYANSKLNKSGSISRGISIGNQQDAILNSNLNLQLSGKLSANLNIEAAISDANIPIQPDGNSQQIQEFDKVFIRIFNDKNNLIAGDFDIKSPRGNYLKLHKKVKGAIFSTKNIALKNYKFKTTASGAIIKGKYCRKKITPIEGIQGPYRLKGCSNETYIVILSGSEKVYIDGKLLIRGQNNDYVVNYNTAEITFTTNKLITKDVRIVVEFEYSFQNYSRFLLFNSNELITDKNRFYFNAFSEQDSKNQTLNIDLNNEQKKLLRGIGDNIETAFYPNVTEDTIYNSSYIYYRLTDTTVLQGNDSIYFDSIYVYSTNPETAKYKLGFSYVGENRGNYHLAPAITNGKIYKWVAPMPDGTPSGEYEPIMLLITPKKKQVFSFGGTSLIRNKLIATYEIALSNNDLNTFSEKDADNNYGYAYKMGISNDSLRIKNSVLNIIANYEFVDKNFDPVERYRSPEFERNWNLENGKNNTGQQIAGLTTELKNKDSYKLSYKLNYLNRQDNYKAFKNNVLYNFNKNGFFLLYSGSYLNSLQNENKTAFYRQKAEAGKQFKKVKFGIINKLENNKWNNIQNDSLLVNSFAFNQWEAYVNSSDSAKSNYFLNYTIRQDLLPSLANNMLINSSLAKEFKMGVKIHKDASKLIKTSLAYRKLAIQDSSLTAQKEDNSLLGRFESNLRLLNGTLLTTTFYELGSGLESKKEYTYVEVDKGLGIYIWNDYNDNSIQEIEEFEIASYKDTANFIRVQLPGEYIKVYTMKFNQVINLRAASSWHKAKGFKRFVSRFSNQTAYRINTKNSSGKFMENINPFHYNNSNLVNLSYSLKNTMSFNRSNPIFGIDYIIQKNARKDLLTIGYNSQSKLSNSLRTRWNVTRKFGIINNLNIGNKSFLSDSYSTRNYNLQLIGNELEVNYQPTLSFRILVSYKYSDKLNRGDEQSIENNLGSNIKYNLKSKGTINFQFNYINYSFTGNNNSPLAYTMLEGFLPGNNITWTLQYQQQIAGSLQLNINYNGRKPGDNPILHSGGIQLRAFF